MGETRRDLLTRVITHAIASVINQSTNGKFIAETIDDDEYGPGVLVYGDFPPPLDEIGFGFYPCPVDSTFGFWSYETPLECDDETTLKRINEVTRAFPLISLCDPNSFELIHQGFALLGCELPPPDLWGEMADWPEELLRESNNDSS